MIRFLDAWTLAMTKLRTRKLRTVVTAVIASLLFAVLVLAFTLLQGGLASYARYSKSSLSTRYLTSAAFYNTPTVDPYTSPELIVKAKELNKQIIEEKKADAKRLGLQYDSMSDPPVVYPVQDTGGVEQLNGSNVAVLRIMREYNKTLEQPFDKVKKLAADYHPTATYVAKSFGDTANLKIMTAGKEEFDPNKNPRNRGGMMTNDISSLGYMPKTIINSFILEKADLAPVTTTDATTLPVVAPYKEVEKALGLASLPKNATNEERLARIEEVKKKATTVTIPVCYRSNSSKQLIETARQQILDIDGHKNDKDYVKPKVIYALPNDTDCGPVGIVKDTRTAEEKSYAAKQHEFDVKYENVTDPVQKKLILRVVGISPDTPDYMNMSTLDSVVMMIGGVSLQGLWIIPDELVDEPVRFSMIPQPDTAQNSFMIGSSMNLIEFSNADDASRFVTERGCTGFDCNSKPSIQYFGGNAVLIENIKQGASKTFAIAGLVVAGIAAIVMMGMIGRVITDSRRETAVFRAIGAKRNDIRLIYTIYVLTFSGVIAVLAILIGFGVAVLISAMQQGSLTVAARLMFIESRETSPFTLVSVWPEALLATFGLVLLTGFTAMLLPLSRNLVRSPLRDMRDE